MKYIGFIILFFLFTSCETSKKVYWCGDHPCLNKKEKEAYFKKTMIVEVRNIKNDKKNDSEMERILKQAKINEKERIKKKKDLLKNTKLKEKEKIKKEKEFEKYTKLQEKKRIKKEKELEKLIKIDEKKSIKEQKKIAKKVTNDKKEDVNITLPTDNALIKGDEFYEIVKKIQYKNDSKSYPNINNIPN